MDWSTLVTTLGLGFLFQTMYFFEVRGKELDDCRNWQYLLQGGKKCEDCPACPAGTMYTTHCGRTQDFNGNIEIKGPKCKPCELGLTKPVKSKNACHRCKQCGNRHVIQSCNATHDRQCSDCKKGFYMESGNCHPCQPCCGKEKFSKEFGNEYIRQKCVDDKMGDCCCRPIEGCTKKCYFNATTSPPILSIVITSPKSFLPTASTSRATKQPIVSSYTETTTNSIISSSTKPNTFDPNFGGVDLPKSKSESSSTKEIGGVDPGWPIALGTICFLFISVVMLLSFTHSNAIKKMKSFMLNNVNTKCEHHESSDCAGDKGIVVRVGGRFEEKARPNFTNYAQLVEGTETDSSVSLQPQNLVNATDDDHALMCACHMTERNTISSADSENIAGPWLYRELDIHRQHRRPRSRAEKPNDAAMFCGEFVQLQELDESRTNTSISLEDLSEHDNVVPPSKSDIENVQENETTDDVKKEGEENSETEETVTAVPVTTQNRDENTVVIAIGQHNETMSHMDVNAHKVTGERWRETKRKKPASHKKSKKKTEDNMNDEYFPSVKSKETLQCTCGKCSYRPYVRDIQLCNCKSCVPQPDDDLYKIIERRCLRSEICNELNKKDVPNWNDLSIYIRIDRQIPDIKSNDNPAHVVLERLKTSRPRMRLEDFNVILKNIRRQDIMDVIMRHHTTCLLCRRNSFDASVHDLHMPSDFKTSNFVKSI